MINVLQLASGKGSRFTEYSTVPKPFIKVDGIPMFLRAYDSMDLDYLDNIRYHVLFQESHVEQHNPQRYAPDAHIHTIDHYTDGAATSAMSVNGILTTVVYSYKQLIHGKPKAVIV